ncbi:MAG: helix-turn-helix domain-containing protein [Sedimentibacter saalensis]|uniref:helix-turn-helix domain-containing protein n=1 Tax=Sedimentibacter saalensis TaxID=130788 RepID=UPI002B1F5FA3|nr:helix-turn-helix domain-containing protein [Sedimentibacter saalensis]MEA5096777.1 helix-turn-helix domain-containing protein [Sedimentibacter saalensis]
MAIKIPMDKIQKQCEVCGLSFVPKTVDSVYCSKKCSGAAYRKKKTQEKKKEEQQAIIDKISADRLYISVPEAIALFGVAKSTLYRLVRQKRIPAINLGTRLVRIDRAAIEEMFPIRQTPLKKEKPTAKLYSLEPQDCYTIGEIAKKFGISDSSVYKHIRKYSIPTRQIGNYVYAPKTEIDNLYNQ